MQRPLLNPLKESRISIVKIINITDPASELIEIYHSLNEAQLRHYYEPVKEGLFIAETPVVIERALEAGYEPVSLLLEPRYLEGFADRYFGENNGCSRDFPVYTAEMGVMREITGYKLTKGALCAMRRKPLITAEDLLADLCSRSDPAKRIRIAVMENVMNPTNLGAIFRSAAALGMDALLMTEGGSDPLYRRCIRVSMGTVFKLPWAYGPGSGADLCRILQEKGFCCGAMALAGNAVPPDNPGFKSNKKLALFLGTEEAGLEEETIRACDYTVTIPMMREVDSLNVSAAAAVAFWEVCRDC